MRTDSVSAAHCLVVVFFPPETSALGLPRNYWYNTCYGHNTYIPVDNMPVDMKNFYEQSQAVIFPYPASRTGPTHLETSFFTSTISNPQPSPSMPVAKSRACLIAHDVIAICVTLQGLGQNNVAVAWRTIQLTNQLTWPWRVNGRDWRLMHIVDV